jgi:GNAT superfamily N-acetyltransferase
VNEETIEMMIEDLITIRPKELGDEALIYQTWLKGLYYGNDWFRMVNKEIFYKEYRKIIDRILEHSHCICAVLKDESDVVLGYAVVEKNSKLHWVFVKSSWRRKGIASKFLISPTINQVSHLTQLGKTLKPKDWVFDPF